MSSVFLPFFAAVWFSTGPVVDANIQTPDDETSDESEGVVLLVGMIGAEVYVDEQLVGTLPGYIELVEGIHFFKVVDDSGDECMVGRDIRFYQGGPPPVIHIDC
jgi:hypothetical protein